MNIRYIAVLFVLSFAVSASAQDSNGTADESRLLKVALAKSDTNGDIVEDPDEFTSKDIPIYCYVDLNDDNPALIKVRYISVKVKGLRPNAVMVTLQHKTKQGETGASFHASPNGTWAEGVYAVEVYIDGKLVEKRTFEILR